jgi:hypothetical protein
MSTTLFAHGPITSIRSRGINGADSNKHTLCITTEDHDVTFFPSHEDVPALIARLRTVANTLSLEYEKREREDAECAPFGCPERRGG